MDSPQSVVSTFKNSSICGEAESRQKAELLVQNPGSLSEAIEIQKKEAAAASCNLEGSNGVLEVFIHQARDIHNICIYHKQDVYAKICLTSDIENTFSTQIINGGGKNPVFNENLRLSVGTVDSSLKCEIWMLSRVRNYLEDQLLGFALVPLSEVLMNNGTLLEKEFSLSSTDLFHSPAGFVQLSLSYSGASPEVMAIPAMPAPVTDAVAQDSEISESIREFDKIEFPDPKIVNENHMMVSEYYGLPCNSLDSQSTDQSFVSSDTENQLSSEIGVHVVESFSAGTSINSNNNVPKHDSPTSSVSNTESPPASLPTSSESSETVPGASKSSVSPAKANQKEKRDDIEDAQSDASGGGLGDTSAKPVVVGVKIEPEQKVVQQEIVDMYMKSMQQFTESLAKMKLPPMDIESRPTNSDDSSSDQKLQAPKSTGARVFYGSRAFF